MSLLDKVKEFAESEEVQKGILKVKENTEEILSEENINKCVDRGFCLDEAEVDAILDGTTLVGAVPSSSRIGPFKEFLPPPIKYVGMELSDVLVSALGFVDVVDAVSVW